MKKLNILTSTCAALILSVTGAIAAAPPVNSSAPDFSLTGTDGKPHSLAEYKGKYVVLEWTNPGCPFVRKHYDTGNLPKLQAEYTKKGVVWLAINSSAEGAEGYLAPDAARKAAEGGDYKSVSALLTDADGKVGHLYGATNTPDMFIINPEGKIVYEGAIDSIASADKSDVTRATNYVQVGLDEALAGKPVSKQMSKPYGCSVKYKK